MKDEANLRLETKDLRLERKLPPFCLPLKQGERRKTDDFIE